MPAPVPPTAFTLTQGDDGDPTITLDWAHTGTNLDRFELMKRKTGTTTWESMILAPKADFGAGPYSVVIASETDVEYLVRALSVAGEVST